ncbi:MAG: DUF975 family protein [Kiritimatiellae bacterium]|nr:DUF975 family protein [Kiritimatiellia bacterium]
MRSSKEIREEAWSLLWKNNHIWKLFGVGALQYLIIIGVIVALYALFGFNKSAEGIVQLVGNLFQAVMTMGLAAAFLGVVRGEERGILSDSFLGYLYPFRAFFAQMVMGLVILAWVFLPLVATVVLAAKALETGTSILALSAMIFYLISIIIALVVSYRYRQLWFIKADDPSSGAFAALKRSVKMMEGNKWRLFKFDMSYWLAALWIFVPIVGWIIFFNYWALGSAIFYRDLLEKQEEPATKGFPHV